MIKIVILVLFIAMVASLFGGAVFLFKDLGTTKRTLYALGLRVTLVVLIILTILYGVFTGQLQLNAPWLPNQAGIQAANNTDTTQ